MMIVSYSSGANRLAPSSMTIASLPKIDARVHVLERRARQLLVVGHVEELRRRERVLDVVHVLRDAFDARLQLEAALAGDRRAAERVEVA